ncbi:MAG TPA: hypothetical protein DHW71_15640 [Gammaproteobacteria bacterium]|nr:hypothetical protein [Gammaproteobacteria bacterium]
MKFKDKTNNTHGHPQSWTKSLLAGAFTVGFSAHAIAAAPAINTISDVQINKGATLNVNVSLSTAGDAGTVNWSKAYGPDDVYVNPLTGAVFWDPSSDMPSESFHIGVKASNLDGSDIEPFIVHVGVNKVVYIGPNEDIKHFNDAFGAWKAPGNTLRNPGTTFVVRNGDYQGSNWVVGLTSGGGVQTLPAGNENQYTTLIAEDPGQVRLSNGAQLMAQGNLGDAAYWAIKGFYMDGGRVGTDGAACGDDITCRPHHIKFVQNGVQMYHTLSSFGSGYSDYILYENNYAFGGHRVKFLAYKTTHSIYRRNVARFDHNQEHTGPKNTFSFYTSTNIIAQNNIVIDGDTKEFVATGELAGEYGCPTTAGDSLAEWDRNIQLNSDFPHANLDLQNGECYATIRDSISWDNRANFFILSRSPSYFDHATFGAIHLDDTPQVVINAWPGRFARGFTNTIFHDVNKGPLFEGLTTGTTADYEGTGTLERYGIAYNNITDFSGYLKYNSLSVDDDSLTAYEPLWSSSNTNGGLRYLVRIEPNSNLSGKASDGDDLGATVMTFKGKSGTMWGEEGYQSETNMKQWPFPFQETIAAKMRSMEYEGPMWTGSWGSRTAAGTGTLSGNRGFAKTDTNLTDYVWGYLGSTVPPMNVQGFGRDESVTVRWDPPAARADITGYKVYDYNPSTKKIANPRNAGNTNSFTVENLTNGQTYYFAVTAISSSTGESSYSYPIQVTASSHARPRPPVLTPHDI